MEEETVYEVFEEFGINEVIDRWVINDDANEFLKEYINRLDRNYTLTLLKKYEEALSQIVGISDVNPYREVELMKFVAKQTL